MMLHRHFEAERNENMTTSADLMGGKKDPPIEEAPKKVTRKKSYKPEQ